MASLMQRGSVWYGRHIYRQGRKRRELKRSFGTCSRIIAERRLAAWNAELDAGRWGEGATVAFDEVGRRFLQQRRGYLKPGAVRRYAVSLEKLKPAFVGRDMRKIGRADVAAFVDRRRRDPGRNGLGQISDGAIRVDLAALSALFSFAIERNWADINPVAGFLKGEGRRGVRRPAARTRYLSHDEERRLLAAALDGPQDNVRDRQLLADCIAFSIETGMRLREQFDLTWEQFTDGARPHFTLTETKSGKPRKVYLSARAQEIVTRQTSARYVFSARGGKAIVDLDRGFKAAAERAGVIDLQWHDLRRTCGCRLLQDRKATIFEVSKWLGHSSVVVTERHYAFLRDEDLADLAQRTLETSR
jgi:integrase/recombinase XerD